MKIRYLIGGSCPAISKEANCFMKNCGLGGEGAFVAKTETIEMNFNSGDIEKIPKILKQAYEEKLGWNDVAVKSI